MRPEELSANEARALEGLDLEALRDIWRKRYGAPPMLRSCDLLRHLLAWRLQTERLGGLAPQVRQLLRRKASTVRPKTALTVGTKLSREWQGRRYDVVSKDGGFACDGRDYKSLSEVARAITGVRWNGPRFFGLRGGGN